MMRTKSIYLAAALLVCGWATAAAADEVAIVSKVKGADVTWQRGDASAAPQVQTLLEAGDRLTAGKGSSLEIRYLADNCAVRVSAGGSATIGSASPCVAEKAKEAAEASPAPQKADIVPAASGAVEITEKEGPFTRVNLGEGMKDAAVGDILKAGDEVYAGPNSTITLFFAVPQCKYTVPPSTVYRVTEEAPCKAAAELGGAAAGTAAAAGSAIPTGVLIGAGVVVVGGGAIAVIATTSNGSGSNNPATPD